MASQDSVGGGEELAADSMKSTPTGVRRAVAGDAGTVRELTQAAYAKWVPVIGREPVPMAADHEAAVREHLVDLLQVGGELAALVEMILGADHLLVENLAVAPAFQGQGHGRALLAHAERVTASLGFAEVRLCRNQRFAENLRLYRRAGYRVKREEAFRGGVVVHLSKAV